jgi:hypothetical protein
VVLAGEPVNGLDLREDAAGDERSDPKAISEVRSGVVDELADLSAGGPRPPAGRSEQRTAGLAGSALALIEGLSPIGRVMSDTAGIDWRTA